ncbi:SLC13 family permease [Blastopirellula marina]|uniref:TrkA-C, di-and tricarboxylate transporter n=1 Tax=Blastopirellula marina DSM 3645 TaxID=314230 RepID=A3ZRE0_9BACT|nr:SLC13 family permease [Blastopirellula marina]EAQ80709.1 TrkA-C, di- and tricarboxylate transporter [Blastopirellula marina DSM 3645]
MEPAAWLTLGVVLVAFVAIVKNWSPPDVALLSAAALLALTGVITPADAFDGFSNAGMLTVAFLFVVAAGLRETGVLDFVGQRLLNGAQSERSVLTRLAAIVIPASAFLNNTPIVAMFLPITLDWCRRRSVAPSKLLIPLSFLAILGGTCTLIGTSTNLVVHGLMIKAGMPGMGLFEIGMVGLPYAVVGVIYLLTIGRRLLPQRVETMEQFGESRREYLVEMQVPAESRLAGKTIEAAGLRHLPGLFLIEIDRGGDIVSPVDPQEKLRAGDQLVFTGIVSSVVQLQQIDGLAPVDKAADLSARELTKRQMCEVVVSANSRLVGRSIRDADFRAAYGAAVLAVHRAGRRIERKVGDIVLQPGDTLLLQTPSHFARAHRNDPAFYLVSDVQQWRPLRRHRAWIALPLFVALIVVMTTGWISTNVAAALVAAAMVYAGCISAGEARRSIEWQVLITIAAAFGIGVAMEKSGAAMAIAETLVSATEGAGPIVALAAVYITVSILTELITNNAVAVLMFPVCLKIAELSDVSPRPFLMALALAASASFMTPIGYQTNMLVYGPGGYRFGDFLKVGAPLNILLGVIAVILIPWIWPF